MVTHRPIPSELLDLYQQRAMNLRDEFRLLTVRAIRAREAIHDADAFAEVMNGWERLSRAVSPYARVADVTSFALRAVASGNLKDRDRAIESLRNLPPERTLTWLQTEAYLALLGIELPPREVEIQWIDGETPETVRERWQQVGLRLIERAKRGDVVKPLAEIPDFPTHLSWGVDFDELLANPTH